MLLLMRSAVNDSVIRRVACQSLIPGFLSWMTSVEAASLVVSLMRNIHESGYPSPVAVLTRRPYLHSSSMQLPIAWHGQ